MGIGLLAQGRDLETNGVWDFKHGEAWNTEQGNMSSAADLRAGRRTNAMVGALTVVALYFLGKRLTNWIGGLTGALFLAAHPLHLYLSSQAVSDALLALILALAALVACYLADRPSWPKAVLLGILLGLGGATKLSPLLIALPLAGLGAVLMGFVWWRRRHGRDNVATGRLGVRLLALPLIAMVTFVAVYPYLWSDPVGNTRNLFAFRVEEMAKQGSNWPDVAVNSRTEALRRVGITLEDRFSTSGRLYAKLMHGLGRTTDFRGVDVPFAVVGGEILLALVVMRGLGSRYALVMVILGAQAAAIVLGMRSDWARYHLPMLLVEAVCIGVLAGAMWWWLRRPVVWLRGQGYRVVDQLAPSAVRSR
jgi:4-amino-4-deoxy-L-arabinose transferase-like glycosyltransferase